MAKVRGNPSKLVPLTTQKAREIGRKGGIRSGEVKREKKLLSEFYGEVLAELYDEEKPGNLKEVAKAIMARADSSTVSLLKEMREATEGNKVALTGADGEKLIPDKITIEIVKPKH